MIIDKLLTKYVDELNSGKDVDIESYSALCPEDIREEFRQLASMAQIFKRNTIPFKVSQKRGEILFEHLEKQRMVRLEQQHEKKMVANFRASDLTDEEKTSVSQVMDEIMKEAFGEED